jgi:outer membrane protein OmpA-like peptidoglycan-associated protein
MLFNRLIMTLFVVALVGCTTVDPYTGEEKTSDAAKGAGIGALSGAILGAATSSKKDRTKGALTGAAVGGAVGGGIGYYMDQQEKALGEELRGTGVQVRREGDNLRLIMPGNITFPTGRSEIRSDFYPVLNSVGKVLIKFEKTAIKVSGHSDSTGDATKNQTLSEERAASVGQYLIGRGVKSGRVQTTGYGSRYPIGSNSTGSGREQNRRVELELLPL